MQHRPISSKAAVTPLRRSLVLQMDARYSFFFRNPSRSEGHNNPQRLPINLPRTRKYPVVLRCFLRVVRIAARTRPADGDRTFITIASCAIATIARGGCDEVASTQVVRSYGCFTVATCRAHASKSARDCASEKPSNRSRASSGKQ